MAWQKQGRDELLSFKKRKFVMAYANSYTQKEYYLNSVASPIYINPVGDMDYLLSLCF
jgi:protease-4